MVESTCIITLYLLQHCCCCLFVLLARRCLSCYEKNNLTTASTASSSGARSQTTQQQTIFNVLLHCDRPGEFFSLQPSQKTSQQYKFHITLSSTHLHPLTSAPLHCYVLCCLARPGVLLVAWRGATPQHAMQGGFAGRGCDKRKIECCIHGTPVGGAQVEGRAPASRAGHHIIYSSVTRTAVLRQQPGL